MAGPGLKAPIRRCVHYRRMGTTFYLNEPISINLDSEKINKLETDYTFLKGLNLRVISITISTVNTPVGLIPEVTI